MSIFVQKTRVFEVFHGKYFFQFFVFNKVKMVYRINGILKLLEQIYLVIANKIRFNIFFRLFAVYTYSCFKGHFKFELSISSSL